MYIDGSWFKDEYGRTYHLRGVNLGGSSKLPTRPNGATHLRDGFYNHRDVSFVGRPFPLDEADEHFARLKHWGLTFVRFLVTWEAVEHAGPGIYDQEYLDYVAAVLERADQHGITVFVDPHQDAWSRWTGGDGAPGWTLEAVGINPRKLVATGAAVNQQELGDQYTKMIWPTNFYKLGAGTMFTLFFAGDDLAPATTIDGVNAREYLQSHFIRAMQQVAQRLCDLPNVVGFDSLNEPAPGFIGVQDLTRDEPHGMLPLGAMPTPLQAMALGSGHTLRVRRYTSGNWGIRPDGYVTLNTTGERLWMDGYPCIWKQNDVWTDKGGKPRALKPYHFSRMRGRRINFVDDYLKPYLRRYIHAMREVQPKTLIFIEGVPNEEHPTWGRLDPPQVAYAGHWYDNVTLFIKKFRKQFNADIAPGRFRVIVGAGGVQSLYNRQVAAIRHAAEHQMGGIPALLGEFGVPFDLDGGKYLQRGDFTPHITALDMYFKAIEASLLNCTIWNYCPNNTNERGDLWNGENLSIFSREHQHDPSDIDSGGRALEAIVRPYPMVTAGEPKRMTFDLDNRRFTYVYRPDPDITKPTVLYVPRLHYPVAYTVECNHGLVLSADTKAQTLSVTIGPEFADATIVLTLTPDEA